MLRFHIIVFVAIGVIELGIDWLATIQAFKLPVAFEARVRPAKIFNQLDWVLCLPRLDIKSRIQAGKSIKLRHVMLEGLILE